MNRYFIKNIAKDTFNEIILKDNGYAVSMNHVHLKLPKENNLCFVIGTYYFDGDFFDVFSDRVSITWAGKINDISLQNSNRRKIDNIMSE